MRMKRFLSLMLAVLMLASLTISASAASKVYYTQDFDYDNVDDAIADIPKHTGTDIVGAKATGSNLSHKSGGGGTAILKNDRTSLTTDASGINWLRFITADKVYGDTGNLYIVPDSTWDHKDNQNETYIISFDMKVDPQGSKATDYRIRSFWESDDAATSVGQRVFHFKRASADSTAITLESYLDFYDNKGPTETITNNTGYKLAIGYTYNASWDGSNVTTASSWQTTKAVNGSAWNTIIHSCLASSSFKPQDRFVGIEIPYGSYLGSSIANIKMYTVDNGGMNVSSTVTGTVPTTTTSIPVKFSQPVYAPSFVPANVTVTTNKGATLTYGSDFTVSAVEEVVGNVGGEIYSTATVNFTSALADNTTYTITFPAAITNEIGTPIAGTTVTFNTPAPAIVVGNKIITKAWGTASEETAGAFAAGAGVYGVSLDITNNTDANKDIAVIYAVYAGGKLEDVVYASDTIAGNETTSTIGAGVNLSEDVTAVKAFIWDGLTAIKPGTDASVWELN